MCFNSNKSIFDYYQSNESSNLDDNFCVPIMAVAMKEKTEIHVENTEYLPFFPERTNKCVFVIVILNVALVLKEQIR